MIDSPNTSPVEQEPAPKIAKPAPWVFLLLIVATALSAGISLSMIAAPQMLSTYSGAGLVPLFLAIGAVYLGMPVTWLLGLALIATYPRSTSFRVTRGVIIAAATWTVLLAVPYVGALIK